MYIMQFTSILSYYFNQIKMFELSSLAHFFL